VTQAVKSIKFGSGDQYSNEDVLFGLVLESHQKRVEEIFIFSISCLEEDGLNHTTVQDAINNSTIEEDETKWQTSIGKGENKSLSNNY